MVFVDGSVLEYRADTLGTIRTLLAGYSGGITIVREMAQNTDDVPGEGDRWLEFHLNRNALVIKNSTTFREIDFTNIIKIARGGKKQEKSSTIGMFGVGFVSVFQLTDAPILRSSGCELHFVPAEEQVFQFSSDVVNHTEFELPYRRQRTAVGDGLGMPEVSDSWIQDTLERLPDEAYRLLFFLRRLNRIAVYHEGVCIRDIRRSILLPATGDQPEIIEIISTGSNGYGTTHRWLRFTGQVAQTEGDTTSKDRQVQIVIPDHDVPNELWLGRSAGRLYNYLPTDIETQLPFQINGDFYPSTDRKSIDNDHPNHAYWNRRVLHAIGECLAAALPTLLAHFEAEPLALYQRLPIKPASSIVAPIQERFFTVARSLAIFHTISGWKHAHETRWADRTLRPVVDGVDSRLMPAPLQSAAWELINKLGVHEYTLADFLRCLMADLKSGQLLADGPWYFQTDEQVELFYTVLEQPFARRHDRQIEQAPIFIDHTARLWTASRCVYESRQEIRAALAESGLHFWSGDAQKFSHITTLVPKFSLPWLWEVLRGQLVDNMALVDGPPWLNSLTKLYRLYDTIIKTHEPIDRTSVAHLPLCLNRYERLCRPVGMYMPENEPRLYDIFEEDREAPLVAKATQDKKPYRRLYEEFGVRAFDWQVVIDRLGKLVRQPTPLNAAHPVLNTQDKLLRIYRYLLSHRTSFERKNIEELRHRLPIWLCRSGMLHYAKDLALPSATNDWPKGIPVDHVFISTDGLGPLLNETLGLKPLDTRAFIQNHLAPKYAGLTSLEQIDVLKYLQTQRDLITTDQVVAQTLKETALLYADDGLLHRPSELCFPASGLHELFPDHLRLLHASYTVGVSQPKDSQWYSLFTLLGVQLVVPATVVESQIKTLVQRLPRETGDAIEAIFRYIERHWESAYASTNLGSKLRRLEWLPAENDALRWYRPTDLYPIQQKRLVDRVAKVLGFKHAQRPQAGIAHALDFPTNVETKLVVRQLLRLSEIGEPAPKEIYRALSQDNVSYDDLKLLHGQAVIYDDTQQHYWKTDHIFLTNQRQAFGRHRLSIVDSELKPFLKKMNVRETPSFKDYLEIILEISGSQREEIGSEDAQILRNTYVALAGAPDQILMRLCNVPCVLSFAGDEKLALRLPQHVVLRPPDRYVRHLPELPIAQYDTDGITTLRRIGVRPIEDVLETEFRLAKDRSAPFPIINYFRHLNYAIRRLLFHAQQQKREQEVMDRFIQLRAYTMPAIQVMYHVRLEKEVIKSDLLNEQVFYDRESQEVYLQQGLNDQKLSRALARVLEQVLDVDIFALSLLKDIIADPGQVREILDENRIQPLPDALDLAPIDERPDTFSLGTALDGTPEELFVQTTPAPKEYAEPLSPSTILPQQTRFDLPVEPRSPAAPSTTQAESVSPAEASVQRGSATLKSKVGEERRQPTDPENASARPNKPRVNLPHSVPQLHPRAPTFTGRAGRSSPAIATDMDGLRDRVRTWAQTRGLSTSDAHNPAPLPLLSTRRRTQKPHEPVERNVARFMLSFPERTDGFLRITGQARDLFASRPTYATCITEHNHTFDLWFNWQRDIPIVYNQDVLPAFFEEQEIPAGGIVYLERIHNDRYRLFYHHAPHTVREVRIASNDQGVVRYDILEEVEVQCETDDTIYRAEKRHEDQPALWLEAADKKSVAETLCDLFMASSELWLHQDDLAEMLGAMRMVAATTVQQELTKQPFFEGDGQGNWRLVPAALLAPQNPAVSRWLQATRHLLESDDTLLETFLESVRPPLDELRSRILRLGTSVPELPTTDDLILVVASVNDDATDTLAAHSLAQAVHHRIYASDAYLLTDGTLREIFSAASSEVWNQVLRPTLHQEFQNLRHANEYERAALLVQHWADFDHAHGIDLQQALAEAEAWRMLNLAEPKPLEILKAIKRAPTFTPARTQLHTAVQKALQQYRPEHWLAHDNDLQTVSSFYDYIATLSAVRTELQHDHQIAFDRTVQLEASKLWNLLGDEARLRLVLQLKHYAPTAMLTKQQLEHLLGSAVRERRRDRIAALLLGLVTWEICPAHVLLQGTIAEHLAHCHIDLQIWELTNNRPWRRALKDETIAYIRASCDEFSSSHLQRQQAFLAQLDVWEHPYHELLNVPWQELRQFVVRDIEALATSAA